MDNQISTTALVLLAVVPVVAGAVLTALFAWLAQRRIDTRDHERWLRERRAEAYIRFEETATRLTGLKQGNDDIEQGTLLLEALTAATSQSSLYFDAEINQLMLVQLKTIAAKGYKQQQSDIEDDLQPVRQRVKALLDIP